MNDYFIQKWKTLQKIKKFISHLRVNFPLAKRYSKKRLRSDWAYIRKGKFMTLTLTLVTLMNLGFFFYHWLWIGIVPGVAIVMQFIAWCTEATFLILYEYLLRAQEKRIDQKVMFFKEVGIHKVILIPAIIVARTIVYTLVYAIAFGLAYFARLYISYQIGWVLDSQVIMGIRNMVIATLFLGPAMGWFVTLSRKKIISWRKISIFFEDSKQILRILLRILWK